MAKTILELDGDGVKEFFMKPHAYSTVTLPEYFTLDGIINTAHEHVAGSFSYKGAKDNESVNIDIIQNKDGVLSWRKQTIIHPFLYIYLVNIVSESIDTIKDRFSEFQENPKIICCSMPVVDGENIQESSESTISNYVKSFEQTSVEASLQYEFLIKCDIARCYDNFYTHSIAWALHTKSKARERDKGLALVGDKIDSVIQSMRYKQTNGIPQGSQLMDFVAEMVLGSIDKDLSDKIGSEIENYTILRYRDDYRIFAHSEKESNTIIKYLSDILRGYGLTLNDQKTVSSNNPAKDVIKADKWALIIEPKEQHGLKNKLITIYDYLLKYPNSNQMKKHINALSAEELEREDSRTDYMSCVSLTTNIMLRNPNSIPECIRLISVLLRDQPYKDKKDVIKMVYDRAIKLPNTDYFMIWLQRLWLTLKKEDWTDFYDEDSNILIQKVVNSDSLVFDNTWSINCGIEGGVVSEWTDNIVDYVGVENVEDIVSSDEIKALYSAYGNN